MTSGAMEALQEFAPAKVNLTLEIPGRRADGYHEIISLVAFADVGDILTFQPAAARDLELETQGPTAAAIEGDNLILRAARAFLEDQPDARGGRFILDKRLPVAAGIGGGSADAAAAVRLLARANASRPSWRARLGPALAGLGADIPVCIEARAAWVRGIGEQVSRVEALPEVPAVLVNPGVALPTGAVFAALGALPFDARYLGATPMRAEMPGGFASIAALLDFLRDHPNDLEPPARRLAPVIDEVSHAIARLPGCLLARLSGSGATCYGLFGSRAEADRAAEALSHSYSDWWIAATRLA